MTTDIEIIKSFVDYYSLKIILGLREEAMSRGTIRSKLKIPLNQISERMRMLEKHRLIVMDGWDRSGRAKVEMYKSNVREFAVSIDDWKLKLSVTYYANKQRQNIEVDIREFLEYRNY